MSEAAAVTAKQDGSSAGEPPKKKASFPTPITILTLVLRLIWAAAFFSANSLV